MATLDATRKAQSKISKQLIESFNTASQPLVNSVGISQDMDGYHVSVGLERQPTHAERKNLPQECDGVAVKYKVIGPIVAF